MKPTSLDQSSSLVNRSPVFYGWVIMLIGTLGLIMTSPGQTYAVSIFVEHLIHDLNLSRSEVSTMYTVGTLIGSFALPLIGRRIDRHGPRWVMVIIALIFGLACVYMGFVQNLLMLLLGFTAIRMFGQGSLSLVSQQIINLWWVRRRGLMNGISGVMFALLGSGGVPYLIHVLIVALDSWRLTYMVLGAILLLIFAPIAALLVRGKPERYGLQPDGMGIDNEPRDNDNGLPPATPQFVEENWTLSEALHTRTLWVFALSLSSISMLSTGLFFHMVSIFEDSGLSQDVAAAVYLPIAVTTAVTGLISGALVDRIPIRFIASAALLFQALSLWMAQALFGVEFAFLYGMVVGTTGGLARTTFTVIWADYFGRQHLGSISGVTTTIFVAGSALGPMPFGIAHDLLGSYSLTLTLTALLPLCCSLLVLFFDRPRKG